MSIPWPFLRRNCGGVAPGNASFASIGVCEYWIVDPERNTVQIFRLIDEHYEAALEFGLEDRLESPLPPGLSIPLSEVFPS
ncbi:MAG: Uma2 family endonuclease [Leptospirillia bacterium]